ncbi:hypothetical protein, partial [Mycobacterium tuberculosis]|uniref:hypothetical protein n=1 Tax=Mycobacterium tuberculosis TaxID=1773 RepID=UPI001BE0EF63
MLSLRTIFKLPHVMVHAGIYSQRDLINKIKEFDPTIKVRPVTISNLYNNKIKHLPVELIYAISAVTKS